MESEVAKPFSTTRAYFITLNEQPSGAAFAGATDVCAT